MPLFPLIKALFTRRNPVYVHYGVTHRCNLRCKMCFLWEKPGEEIPLSKIRSLAVNLGKLGVTALSLGGGEPALREDLPEIFGAFKAQGIGVRILTNGYLENRAPWEAMFASGLREVSVSLDSTRPELVDEICRREGVFARVMESLEFLGFYLKKRGGSGLINTVVSRLNFRELPQLAELAGRFGFSLSLVPLEVQEFGGKTLGCREKLEDLLFTPEEAQEAIAVYDRLLRLKTEGGALFNSAAFLKRCRDQFSGAIHDWPCLAGRLYFSLDPQGNFSLCHRFKGYRGQPQEVPAYEPEFPALFEKSQYFREAEKTVRQCPGCLRPCWAEVSLAFTDWGAFWERGSGFWRQKLREKKS